MGRYSKMYGRYSSELTALSERFDRLKGTPKSMSIEEYSEKHYAIRAKYLPKLNKIHVKGFD